MKTRSTIIILLVAIFSWTSSFGQMIILSGPEQGSYYEFVEDMNNVLKDSVSMPFINMSTHGAAYNFERLAEPLSEYKVALIQMDYLFFMQGIDAQNNIEKTKNIKVLLPLAREEIHFVTKEKSGIKKLSDIDDSTVVGIGDKSQGTYATALYINEMGKINWSSRNYPFDNLLRELILDRVDVFAFVGSAPVVKLDIDPKGLREPLSLVEIDDFEGSKNYTRDTIHAEVYKWLNSDVPTFGVRTVLVVNEDKLTDEDREALKKIVSGLKDSKSKLVKYGHPQWENVEFDNWNNKDWPSIKL